MQHRHTAAEIYSSREQCGAVWSRVSRAEGLAVAQWVYPQWALVQEIRAKDSCKGFSSGHSPVGILQWHSPVGILQWHSPVAFSSGILQWAFSSGHSPVGILQWAFSSGHSPVGILQWAFSSGHSPCPRPLMSRAAGGGVQSCADQCREM
jgi:hypothetical protein